MATENAGRLKIRYRDNDGKVQEVTRLPDPTPKDESATEAPKRGRPAKK